MLGLNDTLTFGRHKGKTVDQVARSTPSYIHWMWENGIAVSDDAVRLATSVRIQNSNESANRFGSAGDWGFPEY